MLHVPSSAAVLCDAVPTAINIGPSTENQLFGTVVEYECDRGHYIYPEMDSSLAIECEEDEQWNNTDIPDCWRECTLQTPSHSLSIWHALCAGNLLLTII